MNASLMTDPTYPEPLRLLPDLEVAAPFPLNALGEVLGGAAAAIVEAVQVPEALAAQSILTAAALATQSHGNVERDGQLIPLSLFALTIAESGDRKSAADRLALRSHYVHQQALLELTLKNRESTEITGMPTNVLARIYWRGARAILACSPPS